MLDVTTDGSIIRFLSFFSKIEVDLLLVSLDHPILNKVASYLWDAYFRLEENDIEGARVALRNSLEVLRKEFIPKLIVPEVSEEITELPKRLEKMLTGIMELLHYGDPHPGPAPRTTTEMIISLTIELLRYLAKVLEKRLLVFQEDEGLYTEKAELKIS